MRRPGALLALALLGGASTARADDPQVAVEAAPILGGTTAEPGWNEIAVRVQNLGAAPVRGEVSVTSQGYIDKQGFFGTAPFVVAPGATAILRVPAYTTPYADLGVHVVGDGDRELGAQRFAAATQNVVMLVDVSDSSRLRPAINEVPIAPTYNPTMGARSASGPSTLSVTSPRFDPTTGDPILPDRPAAYAPASAVVIRSDVLTHLAGPETVALTGWVMAGGTLAIAVARPEDLRHPTLTALVGGEATPASPYAATLKRFSLSSAHGTGTTSREIRDVANPGDELGKALSGYAGGNLRGSLYGSSATYGLGEVHLLAFDPTQKPAVDDPWAQARVVDMTRRAFDRRSSLVQRIGDAPDGDVGDVRKQLDPNEGSRWGIAAAAILLCAYAVVAGPISFSSAARRGKPLRALRWLPAISLGAFLLVVAVGVAARGIRGRARHLSLVEAGAGMSKGAVRRYRGLFTKGQKDLTVRATDAVGIVRMAVPGESPSKDRLLVEKGSARLVDVVALPWQTIVAREDSLASIGDGIAIVPDGAGGAVVVNRTGHDARAAILVLPNGEASYFARIGDGDRVKSNGALGKSAEGRTWLARITAGTSVGAIDVHPLGEDALGPIVDKDAANLADAWGALAASAGRQVDWFPDGVPVVLAQLDGGEGRTRDSGLVLESDRLLVRVVGWGGAP